MIILQRLFKGARNLLLCDLKLYGTAINEHATKSSEVFMENGMVEHCLKVAIIGVPNAGKSTFINSLMERKVCPASAKVHTTRKKANAIFTEGHAQIIFIDTPGLVNLKEYKKFNLERSFIKDSKSTIYQADIIGVIHDASNSYTRERLDLKVIRLLEENIKKPSFLILNKIDMLKSKRKLLDLTRMLTENRLLGKPIMDKKELDQQPEDDRGWPHFQDIFMVSALTGNGLEDVKDYLISKAKPGKWLYSADVWSDQEPEKIVVNTVKAKFLDFLPQEIPYQVKVEMELFEYNDEGVITSVVNVHCPTIRQKILIAGDNDGRLRHIIAACQKDLQHTFQNFVRLNIVLQAPAQDKK